jgi:AraC-like DNA-binding protein
MNRSQDLIFDSLPVVGLENEYCAGFVDPMHSHTRAQLLYSIAGVMVVTTERRSFVIPPYRAAWLPAGMRHEVRYRGRASLRTLYIDPIYDLEPSQCRVLEVTDFLRAMILEAVGFPRGYGADSREGRIVRMLLDEIARMPSVPYHIGVPEDPRLARVCRTILENPADTRVIDDWAAIAGMSRRSFTRSFRQELGMGFALWRQQVRLMEAISLLASGRSIASVAFDVGYESPSAFTAMFNRAFGHPPSLYAPRGDHQRARAGSDDAFLARQELA